MKTLSFPGAAWVRAAAARLPAAILLLALATPLAAQGPDADWRTLETASFRFFYPAPAEDFTRYVASRLEAARERVATEVGYRPEGKTEVLVVDPLAAPNGSAWPLQGWGRLILFTTAPGPDSVLGNFDDWSSLLTLHEEVHLAHLLRPSRRPLEKGLGALVPLGPVGRKSPKWVIEGYATFLEGRLTGFGRPYSDLRPALLRRWAQQGYLPSYGELDGNPQRFLGGSFPYLVGSAYLEWLVAREGEASLRHLWARLSAVESRSFEDAFRGVFGESPALLYRRFCAELTHQALLAEEADAAGDPAGRPGELWLDLAGRPSNPALSPDGASLAIVERRIGQPARLVVYATAPDPEAAEKETEARARLLEKDPEDVPALRRQPLPPKELRALTAVNGGDFQTPRFFRDGKALLLTRNEPGEDGRLSPDLYRFELATGELRRLTHGAGLRDADPLPDGQTAIALRQRYGKSELVQVELSSGAEVVLDAPPFPTTFAQPRVSPDGKRLALLVHREGAWRLEIRALGEASPATAPPLPPGSFVLDPAWSGDGRELYATVGQSGRLELYRFAVDGDGEAARLTREPGAAYGAAPAGAEGVFYLALEPDGYDLRRLPPTALAAAGAPAPTPPRDASAAMAAALVSHLPPRTAAPLPVTEPPAARPYGGGPLELLPLLGGGSGPDGPSFELGLRAGDPVGRREALFLAAAGDQRGGALALRWRGLPWALGLDLFGFTEKQTSRRPETERRGAAVSLTRFRERRATWWRAEIGAGWQESETSLAGEVEESRLAARGEAGWRRDLGAWRLDARGTLELAYGESDPGGSFDLTAVGGRFELAHEPQGGQSAVFGLELGGGRAGGGDQDGAGGARFRLGGRYGSLLPAAFRIGRLEHPGLPALLLAGDRFERARADLEIFGLPGRLFGEKYRFETGEPELELWGAEVELAWAAQPFLRLPAGRLRAGALQILDGPLEDEVELYLNVSWRP